MKPTYNLDFMRTNKELIHNLRYGKIHTGNIVYRIHQISTDKNYIGYTRNFYRRFYKIHSYFDKISHKRDLRPIHKAIIEYGFKDFEVIIEEESKDDINGLERKYIKLYDSVKNGYNRTRSGNGGFVDHHVMIIKDGKSTSVTPDEYYNVYKPQGWIRYKSHHARNIVWVHSDHKTRMIKAEKLEEFLNKYPHYKVGRGTNYSESRKRK